MPQRSGVYARGETITLGARFGRAVNVSGAVNPALRVDALHGAWPGYASYVGGSGASTLSVEHTVTPLERDTGGIVIPANALAQNGKLTWGVHGGESS